MSSRKFYLFACFHEKLGDYSHYSFFSRETSSAFMGSFSAITLRPTRSLNQFMCLFASLCLCRNSSTSNSGRGPPSTKHRPSYSASCVLLDTFKCFSPLSEYLQMIVIQFRSEKIILKLFVDLLMVFFDIEFSSSSSSVRGRDSLVGSSNSFCRSLIAFGAS